MPASQRPSMGAIPYADSSGSGVTFRVWAPFAAALNVAGDFNAWSPSATPLYAEGNGCWSVDAPGAALGSEYKFVVATGAGPPLWRVDPYARCLIRSNGVLKCRVASADE